ncbi:MAG: Signal transduction histidine kinase [Myxococcaceae bacterium]|nr:Signal transduction histidine kinase [Myxococcaceae bacterium]
MSKVDLDPLATANALAEAQATVQALEERLRVVSAFVEGILFEFDEQARYTDVWTSDPALLARPASELLGRTCVEALGEQAGRPFDDIIRRVLATHQAESTEYVLDVEGGRRWFTARFLLAPARANAAPAVSALVRDVTDRKLMQDQIRQSERLASVGLLAAGVAHEVNNPLGYLMLNLERIRKALRSIDPGRIAEIEDAVPMAWDGAERVREIVRDLRTFSRAEDGPASPVDVRAALVDAIEMTLHETSRRITVVRRFDEVPAVMAVHSRLVQLFVNLLLNAAHAMPEDSASGGEIVLGTHTDPSGHAVIEVKDDGRGMPTLVADRVFDPFFTTKPTGTGLGLAICHGIVTSLGGTIAVQSAEGVGSTFRVVLPPATAAT